VLRKVRLQSFMRHEVLDSAFFRQDLLKMIEIVVESHVEGKVDVLLVLIEREIVVSFAHCRDGMRLSSGYKHLY
jgi:hypothetical protein